MNRPLLKKVWNIIFYATFVIILLVFIKRKFILPQLALEDLQFVEFQTNKLIKISDYNEKVVVVNFWQTWCGPCIQEMPSLNEMSAVWDGIEVFCVTDESPVKVNAYILKYPNINFVSVPQISDFGITQFPTTYIYNKKGIKVFSKIGGKNWADPNFIATLKKNWN